MVGVSAEFGNLGGMLMAKVGLQVHKPVGRSDIYIYICRLSLTQISVCVD